MGFAVASQSVRDPLPVPRASPQRLPRGLQRATVFIVDDDAMSRRVLTDLLFSRFEMHEFETGEEALAALEQTWPDVVLLDVVLPGLDGVEICRLMKQQAGERVLPIILVTGRDTPAERSRGLLAGADDFLPKPFQRVELRARVGNLVKLSYYQRQQAEGVVRLTALQQQLEEADRLATLGTFASGVGHELNNVATVLRSMLTELQATVGVDEELTLDLAGATSRLSELARAVQRIARPVLVEQQVDVREVVRDVMWMTRTTGRTKYVAVEFEAPPGAVVARVVPVQLQQVVLNLLTNAADALAKQPNGRIRLAVACEGGVVHLKVGDNGPGLSAEATRHLVEAPFAGGPSGVGSGLGLMMVRQIVAGWGGTVTVDSGLDGGSTIDVHFPADRVPALH